MKFAIVEASGTQFAVQENDTIVVDQLKKEEGDKITFSNVLLLTNDGKTTIGEPYISGVNVTGTLIENKKTDKIRVATYKSKSRYRRVIGHRSDKSVVRIDTISNVKN